MLRRCSRNRHNMQPVAAGELQAARYMEIIRDKGNGFCFVPALTVFQQVLAQEEIFCG